MRLFIAIPFPETLTQHLDKQVEPFRKLVPERWTDPSQWHLTLAFIGQLQMPSDKAVEKVSQVLNDIQFPRAFEFSLNCLGAFPTSDHPKIFWAGAQTPVPQLEQLSELVRVALRSNEIPFDEKPFQAHLTLARFKKSQSLSGIDLKLKEPIQWTMNGVTLYESKTLPSGSKYLKLKSWPIE